MVTWKHLLQGKMSVNVCILPTCVRAFARPVFLIRNLKSCKTRRRMNQNTLNSITLVSCNIRRCIIKISRVSSLAKAHTRLVIPILYTIISWFLVLYCETALSNILDSFHPSNMHLI